MKKFSLNWAKALMTVLMLGMIACGKDKDDPTDPDNSVPDPEGTITVNLSSGIGIEVKDGEHWYGYIKWTGPDNFYLDGYINAGGIKFSICDLGVMRGLGNITAIPSTGFTVPAEQNTSVACETGHGYVVKAENNMTGNNITYIRLYVIESIVSTTGGIMGAKVKYQYPFFLTTLNLSSYDNLDFPKAGGDVRTVEISTNASSWNYSVPSWVNATKSNNTLSISVTPNEERYDRLGYIRITAGEQMQSILVYQP
jgi:hypothetical protein